MEDARIGQTAVAVDRDKNSLQAVKWAVDHLLTKDPSITLIHIKTRTSINHGTPVGEVSPEATREQLENEVSEMFLPYRGFCARKGVRLNEVAMEEVDVAKALSDYIAANHIQNIVVGASNRNALTRKFRNPDVSERLLKSLPEFCAVYVIAKGKPITVRSARSPVPINALPPRQSPATASPRQSAENGTDYDDAVRTPFGRTGLRGSVSPLRDRRSLERQTDYMKIPLNRPLSSANKTVPANALLDGLDTSFRHPRSPSSHESFPDCDFQGGNSFGSMDFGSYEFSSASNDSGETQSSASASQREIEAEMWRLKLELKQTMDMYNNACKEALTAKQQARELHKWKIEEAQKFEELRQAEEAALAMAEMEKARCKAAIEAAQEAQKIAEKEAKKRLHAERKAKRETAERLRALDSLSHDLRYRKYSIEEIEFATDGFSENLKIGEGGYGPVYRACLDHTPVAIKVLRPDAAQGRKQFQQEVEVLSCIRHPNMVLLLGACPEYGCLVYEYMDNGSLEDRLFRRGNTPTIPWSLRFKIAAEIATGLLFLHQTKPEPLVHRDLKPANILLDRNYVSKISDVGLARLVPPSVADSVTQYRVTSTAGTFCYIDPEYQQTGMLGIKSDIYSLGIMLLQIVTARPPMGLTHYVEKAIEKGTFAHMLDKTVPDWPVDEALTYAKLALKCAELRRKDRPDLGTVVLPELNRLRNLGLAYDAARNDSAFGGSPLSPGGTYHRASSLIAQERASHQHMSGPWQSSASSSTAEA